LFSQVVRIFFFRAYAWVNKDGYIGSCIRAFDWYWNQQHWWPWKGHFTLCFKIHAFSEPTTKISMKIDPHCQRQRCSAMTVVSESVKFMRIFPGIYWRRGIKRKRPFSELSDPMSSAPYEKRPILLYSSILSLVAFPLTPKYMTLNDLDGHFTLNFH